jgi:hypothetical protein
MRCLPYQIIPRIGHILTTGTPLLILEMQANNDTTEIWMASELRTTRQINEARPNCGTHAFKIKKLIALSKSMLIRGTKLSKGTDWPMHRYQQLAHDGILWMHVEFSLKSVNRLMTVSVWTCAPVIV